MTDAAYQRAIQNDDPHMPPGFRWREERVSRRADAGQKLADEDGVADELGDLDGERDRLDFLDNH